MTNSDADNQLQPPLDITDVDDTAAEVPSSQTITWQAYEHPPQARSTGWYVGLIAVALVLMALAIFLIKSWSFALVIAAAAAALMVYVGRPPRTINYVLNSKGLYVDDMLRPIEQYKAFGVRRDSDQFILTLLPTKRFMPSMTAYFPESAGEEIVDFLAARMPMQEIQPDTIDKIVRKLRL